MNFFKKMNIYIYSLLIVPIGACSLSNANVIQVDDVNDCTVDFDSVNFCKKNNLELYNEILKKNKPNFDNNKYIDSFKYNGVFYFFVVELNKNKVYTLPNSVTSLKNTKTIDFKKNSNNFCLSGNVNQYQNAYRKSKVCYRYENGEFKLDSTESIVKVSNYIKTDINNTILPTSSDYFSKCLKGKSQRTCDKLSSTENHVYMLNDIKKISPEIVEIINTQKIKNLNLDGFKFIPDNGKSKYIIGEKYQDTDSGTSTYYYLLKIKPNIDVKNIGSDYSIDKQFNLIYKDASGNKKNLKLD